MATRRPGSIREWARAWLGAGYHPIPLIGKNPAVNGDSWQDHPLTLETINSRLRPSNNLGLLLGPDRGRLVDMDCDCLLSRHSDFLSSMPDTPLRFVRSTGVSHYLYRLIDDPAQFGWRPQFWGAPRREGYILEIRYSGQAMCPGSKHPETGEEIALAEYPIPDAARIASADLIQAARYVAVVCQLARSWPQVGTRHNFALQVSGGLVWHGLDVAWVKEVVQRAARLAGDEEWMRRGDPENAAERLGQDVPVAGFPTIERTYNWPGWGRHLICNLIGGRWREPPHPTTPVTIPVTAEPRRDTAKEQTQAERYPYWSVVRDAEDASYPKRMTLRDLMTYEFPRVPALVEKLVSSVGVTVLGGPKKQGKSFLMLQMLLEVAKGGEFFGQKCVRGSVLYYVLEDGLPIVQDRLRKMVPDWNRLDLPIAFDEYLPPLNSDAGMELLCRAFAEESFDAIAIDTLAAAKSGRIDENSAAEMGELFNNLRKISQFYQKPILMVHHHGKTSTGDPGFDLRGSSAIAGATHRNLSLVKGGWFLGEGKSIEEFRWSVRWNQETWKWERTFAGDVAGAEAKTIPEPSRESPELTRAKAFIRAYLADPANADPARRATGPMGGAAAREGISRSTFYRAIGDFQKDATILLDPRTNSFTLADDPTDACPP